jgi:uncharacterized membrane protein YeaQ/YmgE (transglycosylase-associated protein family)
MFFAFVEWAVVGLIVGFVVSKVLNLHGDDPKLGIGVAAIGAVVAGFLAGAISSAGVSAWNPWSIAFAAVGAAAGAAVWHGVRSRYVSRAAYSIRRSN